jgi:hypothetical protein
MILVVTNDSAGTRAKNANRYKTARCIPDFPFNENRINTTEANNFGTANQNLLLFRNLALFQKLLFRSWLDNNSFGAECVPTTFRIPICKPLLLLALVIIPQLQKKSTYIFSTNPGDCKMALFEDPTLFLVNLIHTRTHIHQQLVRLRL